MSGARGWARERLRPDRYISKNIWHICILRHPVVYRIAMDLKTEMGIGWGKGHSAVAKDSDLGICFLLITTTETTKFEGSHLPCH